MLLALALMGQSLAVQGVPQDMPLNANAMQAVTCGRAVMASAPAGQSLSETTLFHTLYFMMSAADSDPGTEKRYLDRVTELAPQMFSDAPKPSPAQLTATLATCDKTFPRWRSTAPLKLPAKGYDRDMMCGAVASYASGFLQSAGIMTNLDEYKRLQQGFIARVPDSLLKQRGIVDQDTVNNALEAALRGSLRVGNLNMLLPACTRELDGK